MCILALYYRKFDRWPLVVAANRDEYFTRPSDPPQMLGTEPVVFGGRDRLAGGTWLGVNEHGLVAGMLNRRSVAREDGMQFRSRGLLCRDILRARNLAEACRLLERQNGACYRPFNLLFADPEEVYVAYNDHEEIRRMKLERGLHVFGNNAVYDAHTGKMEHAYFLFSRAEERLREEPNRLSWVEVLKTVLSDHTLSKNAQDPKDAICVHTETYGTVSSSVIFFSPAEKRFYNYYAPGPACREDFQETLAVPVL